MLTSRSGEEIGVALIGRGGRHEIETDAQLHDLLDSSNYGYVAKKSILKMDLTSLWLISKITIKKAANSERGNDRVELLKRNGLDAQKIEIRYNGKTLLFEVPPNMHGALAIVYEVFVKNQYDVDGGNVNGKVVIDCGANIGMFAVYSALHGARKVYAFEPLSSTYEMLCRNVAINHLEGVIFPEKFAVGDKDCTAMLNSKGEGDVMASIELKKGGNDTEEVKVTSLDSFLSGEEAGFIKMDVEGSEENALIGAKGSIAKSKPVLSLSAYHKPTDKTRLPEVILSIRPDYRIKLNNYAEDDFYCD
jgi:FkbM family methyltransferase